MSRVLPYIPQVPCMDKYKDFKPLNPRPGKTLPKYGPGPNFQQSGRISVNVSSESCLDDLLKTDFDSCSETELKQLKDEFITHAGRIRSFIKQIEARERELNEIEEAELHKQGNSVKKSSNTTGHKRMMPMTPDREAKRSKSMELNSTDTRKLEATMMRKCGSILEKLMQHKHGWVFNKPVDVVALRLPDYYQIIKRPMDLGTIKSKLGKGGYATPLDFAKDVRLTFDNAMLYNLKGDDVHTMAAVFLDSFDKLFGPAYEKYEVDCQRAIVEQSKFSKPLAEYTQDDAQEALYDVTPLVKTLDTKKREQAAKKSVSEKQRPVPEVKANPEKRGIMSEWERGQLGLVLQDLAEKHLDEIVQIISKRNSKLTTPNGDGEIELDVHALDNQTMWDLHQFARLNLKAEQNA